MIKLEGEIYETKINDLQVIQEARLARTSKENKYGRLYLMENKLYQWLTFIDNENKELVKMAVKKNKEIKKANEEWEYLTGDEEIKRLEFLELKAALDYNSRLDYDRRMMAEEVKKEVKKEKAIEIAKRMLELGISIDIIISSTELTEEEINNIKM